MTQASKVECIALVRVSVSILDQYGISQRKNLASDFAWQTLAGHRGLVDRGWHLCFAALATTGVGHGRATALDRRRRLLFIARCSPDLDDLDIVSPQVRQERGSRGRDAPRSD